MTEENKHKKYVFTCTDAYLQHNFGSYTITRDPPCNPPNWKIQINGETFDLLEMRDLKLRVQKLEAIFDHIRQKSSMLDEFIKIAESAVKDV